MEQLSLLEGEAPALKDAVGLAAIKVLPLAVEVGLPALERPLLPLCAPVELAPAPLPA